jgi:protein SCO1/2
MKQTHIILFLLICFLVQSIEAKESNSDAQYQIGTTFKLIDHNSEIFESDKIKQNYLLVFFGYGSCPTICPTSMLDLTNFMGKNKNFIKKVQPVFITLEPEKDTPFKLKEFAKKYHSDIKFLTSLESNKSDYIKDLVAKYKVYSERVDLKEEEKKALGEKEDYVIQHTSFFYLVDKKTGHLIKPVHNLEKDLGHLK